MVFKQTAESVNDVVSFLCPDKHYLTHTMYVSFVSKSKLFRVVQVFMFDIAFCAPSPVYFSSHVDDVKADIWMVCYTWLQ